MKRVILLMVLTATTLLSYAQSKNNFADKRMTYGFSVGVNYSNLLGGESLPENAAISNNMGFRLGILGEYKVSKILFLQPKMELSFNDSKVTFSNTDGTDSEYLIMPVSIDFMAHLMFKKEGSKLSPYFFVGPDYKISIANDNESISEFPSGPDLAIDFGIGFDKAFTHFLFAPELRYSYGLLDVNENPALHSLNLHNVSLIFNFKG